MNLSEFVILLPVVIPVLTAVWVLVFIAVNRSHFGSALSALIGLGLSLLALILHANTEPVSVTPLILFDAYSAVYLGLMLAAAGVTVVLSYGYLERFSGNREEYYLLLLLATAGAAVLTISNHFAALFLGFELLSVSLYVLISYPNNTSAHVEAGMKYLILAAVSSAFLLFGMALVYAGTGALDFTRLVRLFQSGLSRQDDILMLAGVAMILVGVGFKLALVPFHLWTPDVYQGAPAPVAGFVATVSKGSMLALLVRFFSAMELHPGEPLYWALFAFAVLSMFAGNLLALLQNNVKRILAYSSIAHLGYVMVAFLSGGALAKTAVAFYLSAYFVTALGAFGIVTVLSTPEKEAEQIDDYAGLFWRRPWLGGVFAVMLLSLAGIPVTAGFTGKFYLVASGVEAARWGLVLTLVVTSTIGLFYYLRIVGALFARPSEAPSLAPPLPTAGCLMLGVLVVLLLWLGVLPASFIHLIHSSV
jgi:NADH-quinone oxidoreductase subunit N